MTYKDFPTTSINSNLHLTKEEYEEYLKRYAEPYEHLILFNSLVTKIQKVEENWILSYTKFGESFKLEFDFVLVCVGHNVKPRPVPPEIKGLNNFQGEIIHTKYIRNA